MPLKIETAKRKDLTSGLGEMQHRHFASIAAIIRALPTDLFSRDIAIHFANELRQTNPRFDRARFLAACEKGGD